jgi:hypothetical protein
MRTQSAAVAAAELAAEQEIRARYAELRAQQASLERQAAELAEREELLHGERSALDQALDKLRAERRREEELHRSRQQKWYSLVEADRTQAERTLTNLQQHRQRLEERERALNARDQAAVSDRDLMSRAPRSEDHPDLAVLRAEAARDHRLALEQRWIAGQLWVRLAGSGLVGDSELQDSLGKVRRQLEMLYRREREALEDIQEMLAETVRQIQPTPRDLRSRQTPRVLAFTG